MTVPLIAITLFILFVILVYICLTCNTESFSVPPTDPYYDPLLNTSWNDALPAWDWQPVLKNNRRNMCRACKKDYCS